MQRAFICGFFNFPRGSAGANYVQYLGKALQELGYQIIIISNINHKELAKKNKERNEFIIEEIKLSHNKVLHYLQYNYLISKITEHIFKKYSKNERDIFICYSTLPQIVTCVRRVAKRRNNICAACIVELYEKRDFSNSKKIGMYKNYKKVIDEEYPKFDILFPISSFIADYYKDNNLVIQVLPIMADPDEYNFYHKINTKKRKFIYPANGKVKDALPEMLKGISCLSDRELQFAEFHICGVSEEKIAGILETDVYKNLRNSIIVHDWLEYDELIKLYQSMDYLLMARTICQLTLANFPSKVPEVMCYGVIPVVSRVGDYTEFYLENGINSIIFDDCTPSACYKAIKTALALSDEKRNEMASAARKCAVERFGYKNWTSVINKTIKRAHK